MRYLGRSLGEFLMKEGLVPPNARMVEMIVPADGAVILRYEVYVERDDLGKLARALLQLGEQTRDT